MNREYKLLILLSILIVSYLVINIVFSNVGLFKEEYENVFFLSDSVFRGEPLDTKRINIIRLDKKVAQ